VATFNVYGSDHARLQGVATPAHLQRQGHATRLLKQLEVVLADVGVQDLVVILEPQVGLILVAHPCLCC
jgi:predicted GNAT family acetyltransferase